MGIAFTDDDYPLVETVSDRFDPEEENEETASNAGSEVSMSEFDGPPSELPPECLFGPKECRCTFELSSDNPAIYRVCGVAQGVCKRPGHATGEKAEIGYYEPILARKYVDGKLNTFLSTIEFAVREKERGEAKALEMKLASSSLATRKESPTTSEEEAYHQVRPSYAAMVSNKKRVPKVEDRKMAAKPSPVDTAPLMSTGDVFLKSPTLKKLDASGMASNAVEPATMMMFGMMDEMKRTMEKMNSELSALKVTPSKEPMLVSPYAMPDVKPPIIPVKKEISSASKSGAYYGVGHGLDGVHGVFRSWGDVAPLVMGVSKAVYKRFNSSDEAQEFVDISQAVKAKQRSELPDGMPSSDIWYAVTNSNIGQFAVFPSWTAAQQHVTNVSGASVRKFCTYGEDQSYVEGHQAAWQQRFSDESPAATTRTGEAVRDAGPHLLAKSASDVHVDEGTSPSSDGSTLYPPGKLMGEDPSTGKPEELFGIDTEQSEEELLDALCPPDLSESMARSLINGTIDAVALPGGLNSGGELEGSSSEVGMLGEALEELVTQNRGSDGRSIRTDLRWRTKKRTALRSVTNEDKLRVRIKHLKKLSPKVYKRMETLTSSVCKRSGWTDRVRIHTWSTYGFLPVIVASSLRWYLSLHEHLLETSTECGWSYVTTEIDHHVEELELIRTLADSRIHAICSLFCYLRDGKDKGWYSTTIQQKRNLVMAKSEASSNENARRSGAKAIAMAKSEASSNENARRAGAKALRTNLALGTRVDDDCSNMEYIPTPPGEITSIATTLPTPAPTSELAPTSLMNRNVILLT
jgi:hypothetical protein